ncbi:MAG TPA: GNAT family N-acetyltransferase [Chloroflexota bacterium]|nr:GNAT family N-acetyltransferase [Chloroflexota bacterium]
MLLRAAGQADRPRVETMFQQLAPDQLAMRFHSSGRNVDDSMIDLALGGHALVAERDGAIVALASYYPLRDPSSAEMAIVVADAEHRRGLGTALFERLAHDARAAGIRRFLALVLARNPAMLALLDHLGFRRTRHLDADVFEVSVDLHPDPEYLARFDARRHIAALASLGPLFHPRAVAVIGASRRAGTIGNALFHNLLAGGFSGTVYPVHPTASAIDSVRAYVSVAAIPEPIDLAMIVVPAVSVLAVAHEALAAGARALVVISAGFAEAGEAGKQRQNALLDLCRSHGARLVGPNCMGVLARVGEGTMNATFAPSLPPVGPVTIASQSGALGIAILEQARSLGLGIASFVSVGNKADLSSNDLIEYWEEDPATRLIVLYLESFGNPRRFARIARRVGARKPIVAVKGGRGAAGRRAAASHTAALAGSEVAVDALFRQAGVIRCDTLQELFEVSTLLVHQPLPEGNRVAVLTNAGGLGILCADACEASGLVLPALTVETTQALRALLPPEAAVANPVDMLASGPPASYGGALRLLLADPNVDSVIVLFIPPLVTNAEEVAAALSAACDPAPAKPVLACFVGVQGIPSVLQGATTIPSYTFPESAARALGHAAARAAWLRRPRGEFPLFPASRPAEARSIVEAALATEERPWLEGQAVRAVLHAYDIAMPEERLVHSAEEAAAACEVLGAPVAVKLLSRRVLHKSEVGGVRLNLDSPAAAAAAYQAIATGLAEHGQGDAMEGALVQPMVTDGVECLVGVVTDPVFGPLVAFGMGGVTAELLGDVAFRLHPLSDVDADELIGSVKVSALLRGYRGAPAANLPAARDLLLRLSRMIDDLPEILELDFNPVLVRRAGAGALVLDARIRVGRQTT